MHTQRQPQQFRQPLQLSQPQQFNQPQTFQSQSQGHAAQESQFRERANSMPSYGNRYGRVYDKSNQKCHTCGQLGHFSFESGKFQGTAMAITIAIAEPIQGSSQIGQQGSRLNYSRGRGNRGK